MQALITGFPGFISAHLVDALRRHQEVAQPLEVLCLTLPWQLDTAQALARRIEERRGSGTVRVIAGDITLPGLGLTKEDRSRLEGTLTLFHLAAIYDLKIGRRRALEVNLGGTRRVLDLASRLPALRRLVYFSSCYVAGCRRGVIAEDELASTAFRNAYEATKHAAEVEVRRWMDQLPLTIVRPAIVTGVQDTGETSKYDGPYMVVDRLAALERAGQLHLASWLPGVGRGRGWLHTVPVDHVASAAVSLAGTPAAEGRTVHLAPPSPPTTDELIAAIRQAFEIPAPTWRIPRRCAKALLTLPGLAQLLGIPHQLLDYFDQSQHFDDACARELLGLPAPDPLRAIPAMVAFVRRHPTAPEPFSS